MNKNGGICLDMMSSHPRYKLNGRESSFLGIGSVIRIMDECLDRSRRISAIRRWKLVLFWLLTRSADVIGAGLSLDWFSRAAPSGTIQGWIISSNSFKIILPGTLVTSVISMISSNLILNFLSKAIMFNFSSSRSDSSLGRTKILNLQLMYLFLVLKM